MQAYHLFLWSEQLFNVGNAPCYSWAVNHIPPPTPKHPSMAVSWTWVWAEPQTQARTCAEDSRREELSGRWSLCFKDQGDLEPPLSPWGVSRRNEASLSSIRIRERKSSDRSPPDAGHLQVLGPSSSQNSTCRAVCASVEASPRLRRSRSRLPRRGPGFSPWVGKIPGEGNGYWLFLPGEFHGQWSLVGSSPRLAESNTLKDSHLLICVTGCYRVSG